jgi:hypothetical protein
MSHERPSALELFERFRPRFEKVELVPLGFTDPFRQDGPTGLTEEKLYLTIHHAEHDVPIEKDFGRGDFYFDWGEAGIEMDFKARRGQGADSLQESIMKAVWSAICAGPLKGASFIFRPILADRKRKASFFLSEYESRSVRSVLQGKKPKGLHIPSDLNAKDWSVYIPNGPEKGAILAALRLEQRQNSIWFQELCEAEEALDEMLAKSEKRRPKHG